MQYSSLFHNKETLQFSGNKIDCSINNTESIEIIQEKIKSILILIHKLKIELNLMIKSKTSR